MNSDGDKVKRIRPVKDSKDVDDRTIYVVSITVGKDSSVGLFSTSHAGYRLSNLGIWGFSWSYS